jgi:uncharacterized LabA/DUF88 family protein
MSRVMAFIDGSNLFWASKEVKERKKLADYRIDYAKLVKELSTEIKHPILRTYYYGSMPYPAPPKQESYYSKLQLMGIKVRLRKLQHQGEEMIEKGVDMLLAMDVLSLAHQDAFDVAILVSHDQDFVELVERVQALGKIVHVAGFREMISHDLRKSCDMFTDLWLVSDKIQFEKPADPVNESVRETPNA